MATFLKSLRGDNGELRLMLEQIQNGKSRLEALVQQAETSAESLQGLSAPISAAHDSMETIATRLDQIEARLAAIDALQPKLDQVHEAADAVTKAQSRIEAQLAHATEDTERIQTEMQDLRDTAERVVWLRAELREFLAQEGPLNKARTEADELAGKVKDLSDGFTLARERQDELSRGHRHTLSRLDAFDTQFQRVTRDAEETTRRVNAIRATVDGLGDVEGELTDTRHQLTTLKALADQVGQKAAALERQRDAIERAASQASNLTEMMREIDAGLRRQEEERAAFEQMEADVRQLQSLHEHVLERSHQISAQQQKLDGMEERARKDLAELQEMLRQNVERFELENRGLDTVSQRIADLRGALGECEGRFGALEENGSRVAELQSRADALMQQLTGIAADVRRLDGEAAGARGLRSDVARLDEMVSRVTEQVERLDEARPAIEEGLEGLASLGRTREAIAENLEQMRLVFNEIKRVRASQSETETWLTSTGESLSKLQHQVSELEAMAPALDLARKEVESVKGSMEAIESRRGVVEDIHRHLGELAALGTEIDSRSKGLESRVEAVEAGFVKLVDKSEQAERVARGMDSVGDAVEDAERRIATVAKLIGSLESRSEDLQSLSERVRFLGRELDQRQSALEKASEHLERAAALREESAGDAQRLEQLAQTLSVGIGSVERRAQQLTQQTEDLEDRAGRLDLVERRFDQFDERLARWERAEVEVKQALDQLEARRGTIDGLQADIKHMFEMAERTVEDARAVAMAQREIEDLRGGLESVLGRLRGAEEVSRGLEERKRQIEAAEKRLARADALLINIRSSLEALEGQRSLVDYVVEKAGTLTFQIKQAEALIETLREERDVTNRVRTAFERLRDDGQTHAEAG